MQSLSPYLVQNWNLYSFGLFWPNFGYHGNSLVSGENSGSIFEFNNTACLNCTCAKFFDFLQGIEICAILVFGQIWLPWQLPWLSWNYRYHIWSCWRRQPHCLCEKFLDFLHRTDFSATLAYFAYSLFRGHGNSLGSLEILDGIFEFADSEDLTVREKKSSISCAELKSVQFLLIFAQIWLQWQLPWLSWKLNITVECR